MNDKKSTPLREKMKADLMLRNYSKHSEELYLYHVRRFAEYYHKSPELLGLDEIRSYLLYLRQEANVSQSSYKQTVAALRFLCGAFDDFEAFIDRAVKSKWVVRTKPPFAGPEVVLKYLARYTQRVAIGNSRIVALKDGKVSFSYKDYRTNEKKLMTLPAVEFIRRFLLHVLPSRFVRVRYYGFLTRAKKLTALATIRAALGTPFQASPPKPATTPHSHCCPVCKLGKLVPIGQVPHCSIPGTSPPTQHTALS